MSRLALGARIENMAARLARALGRRLIARARRRPPDFEIGQPDDPYLRRWYLIPRNPITNVYLHLFLRSDDDRALHDHPWPSCSILLHGAYWEVLFRERPRHGAALPRTLQRLRAPGRPVLRGARTAHRIVLRDDERGRPIPVWSLFLTGPRLRVWGFWCPLGRWVHWQSFTAGPRGQHIGRGCQ